MSQSYISYVGENPKCFWFDEIKKRNIEYINRSDPIFSDKVLDLLKELYEKNPTDQFVCALIRQNYSQFLETLFSTIFACMQSPLFIEGWLSQYHENDIELLIEKINSNEKIYSYFGFSHYSWNDISSIIYQCDSTNKVEIVDGFSKLLKCLADEFLDDNLKKEYNSIKHGNRISLGGFRAEIAGDISLINAKRDDQYLQICGSDFGTTFLEPIKMLKDSTTMKNIHISFEITRIIWHPKILLSRMDLMCMIIKNVMSKCLLLSMDDPQNIVFYHPIDTKVFCGEIIESSGINCMRERNNVREDDVIQKGINKNNIQEVFEKHSFCASPSGRSAQKESM